MSKPPLRIAGFDPRDGGGRYEFDVPVIVEPGSTINFDPWRRCFFYRLEDGAVRDISGKWSGDD